MNALSDIRTFILYFLLAMVVVFTITTFFLYEGQLKLEEKVLKATELIVQTQNLTVENQELVLENQKLILENKYIVQNNTSLLLDQHNISSTIDGH